METYLDEIDDEILVLVADGGLDAHNARALAGKLDTLISAGIHDVIVDCSRLTFMSSSGIGTLLKLNRQLNARGGRVHLAGTTGAITQVIRLARLENVLGVHPDVGRAKHALRRTGKS